MRVPAAVRAINDLPRMLIAVAAFTKAVRLRWRTYAGMGAGIAFLAVVFVFVLPRLIDYGEVWRALRDISWPWWIALGAAAALNTATFAPPLMAALPGIRFRPALTVTLTSTASTYVAPGGPAVGMALSYAMLRGWGFRGQPVTLAVAVTSMWNLFVTFGTPAIALALVTAEGGTHPALETAALAGLLVFGGMIVLFGLALRSCSQARLIGDRGARIASAVLRVVRRGPVHWSGETFVRFRHDAIDLLRSRWHWLSAATLAGHLTVYVVLMVTLRAIGITGDDVTFAESFAAWSFVRVLAAIPIVPGGFGVVEVGLTGSLLAFGAPRAETLAAVLVYRFMTIVPPVGLGALLATTWRGRNPQWTADDGEASAASSS